MQLFELRLKLLSLFGASKACDHVATSRPISELPSGGPPSESQCFFGTSVFPTQVEALTNDNNALHSIFSPAAPTNTSTLSNARSNVVTPSSKASDVFFSPQSTLGSPFSAITHDTVGSFKRIPRIEMLSLEYIQTCTCPDTLENICTVLQEDGNNYPSLLRATRERLQAIPRRAVRDSSTTHNHNESTLVMSLSSSSEEDDDSERLLYAPTARPSYQPPTTASPHPLRRVVSTDDEGPPNAPAFHLKSRYDLAEKHSELHVDTNDVQRLTQTIRNLEQARTADQTGFLDKISRLQEAERCAEATIQSLQEQLTSTTTRDNDMLEKARRENERLQQLLQDERSSWETRCREVTRQERELSAQIRSLQDKLSAAEDRTLVRKNHSLSVLLRKSQENLQQAQQERNAMIASLLRATGQTETDVSI